MCLLSQPEEEVTVVWHGALWRKQPEPPPRRSRRKTGTLATVLECLRVSLQPLTLMEISALTGLSHAEVNSALFCLRSSGRVGIGHVRESILNGRTARTYEVPTVGTLVTE